MKDDRAYLLHIRDAIDRIRTYTAEGRDAFLRDARTQDAVIRNLEIVGEASKCLSAGFKESEPDVPWKRIAGLRDVLAQQYFGIQPDLVWEVVATNLGPLRDRVTAAIDRMG